MPDHIMISELFGPTIQGEGALAGQVSHFLRTAGCPYRCSWCDSMHAVDPKQIKASAKSMETTEIVRRVKALPKANWITLTGGDPVAWDLEELIWGLKGLDLKIAVETQGSLWREWLELCNLVTISPKPPSSGMEDKLDPALLQKYMARLHRQLVCKIVVFNDADLEFAERIHRFMAKVPLYLSAGTPTVADTGKQSIQKAVLNNYKWLVDQVLSRPRLGDATVLPQLHVLLWDRQLGR